MNGWQAYGLVTVGVGVLAWCVWYIRRSFRRGWIAYGGNSRSTMKTQRYHREVTALGFYGGVAAYALVAAIAAAMVVSIIVRQLT